MDPGRRGRSWQGKRPGTKGDQPRQVSLNCAMNGLCRSYMAIFREGSGFIAYRIYRGVFPKWWW